MSVIMELDQEIKKLEEAIEFLRAMREDSVSAEVIGTRSMTPLKAIVHREALLWRFVELGDGLRACIHSNNTLGALVFARGIIECAAVQHQLNRAIQSASGRSAEDIDKDIVRLLMGTRFFSIGDPAENIDAGAINILTCLRHLDGKFEGVLADYEYLCEFAHPNWAGTAGLFSFGNATNGLINLGRYPEGNEDELKSQAVSSAISAILIFTSEYTEVVKYFQPFFDACDTT